MLLKDVLKHISCAQKVQIARMLYPGQGEEILFEGCVDQVPWTIVDMKLDTDIDGEAIYAFTMNDDKEAWIGIYVWEG